MLAGESLPGPTLGGPGRTLYYLLALALWEWGLHALTDVVGVSLHSVDIYSLHPMGRVPRFHNQCDAGPEQTYQIKLL